MSLKDADPKKLYDKLTTLLHEATRIEQALMIQYLYASFSIKPLHEGLRGEGSLSEHRDLLGVAIEEMRHMNIVILFLKRLDRLPDLAPVPFPFKSLNYTFPMELEPLSAKTLAQYVFIEAPESKINPEIGNDPDHEDHAFVTRLYRRLGPESRPNLLDGLYDKIIDLAERLSKNPPEEIEHLKDEFPRWIERLKSVQSNGLEDHFEFFHDLFMKQLPITPPHPPQNVWDLPITDANYPARNLSTNIGMRRPGETPDGPTLNDLVTLGNLHYWIVLGLLNMSYRFDDWRDPDDDRQPRPHMELAQYNMRGPLIKLALHLADHGVGLPFARFPEDYCWENRGKNIDIIQSLIDRADRLAHRLGCSDRPLIAGCNRLPNGFKLNIYSLTSSGLVSARSAGGRESTDQPAPPAETSDASGGQGETPQ